MLKNWSNETETIELLIQATFGYGTEKCGIQSCSFVSFYYLFVVVHSGYLFCISITTIHIGSVVHIYSE